jgi:transcriptional regulator with XRE-family HTH domain
VNDEEFDELFLRLAAAPDGDYPDLSGLDLTEPQRDELDGLMDTAKLMWIADIALPTLEQDRTAALLGLLPDQPLEQRELARVRKNRKMTVTDLAERLSRRGWEVSSKTVYGWETGTPPVLSPALLSAVAEELETETAALTSAAASGASGILSRLKTTDAYVQVVQRMAALRRISFDAADGQLSANALSAVYRGDAADETQMIKSLEALVTSLEFRAGSN